MPDLIACKTCGQIHAIHSLDPGYRAKCRRCGSTLLKRTAASLHLTAAFSLAALILYVPANLFPIMHMVIYGASSDNTVWSGTVRLYQNGDVAIAVIVFLASILIPLLKLAGLFTLVAAAKFDIAKWKLPRTRLYRFIDSIGRWAMLDVFVLAILVSIVKLHDLATILPGKGAVAFAAVVVLTILASVSFDPQLIWQEKQSIS